VESDLIAGIYWVRDQKVANPLRPMVANLSLGQPGSATVDNAITTLISAGVTVVTSAGNSNANACSYSPARVPGALTVGATTSTDARASFSNFGSCLDLFAPGQDITSLSHSSDAGTALNSGTSMAAPHVSGVAALYLEEKPGSAPAAVHNALRLRATSSYQITGAGSGSVNLLLFSRPVIYVDIAGELIINVPDDNNWSYHTWTAEVGGGRAPYTYQWEVSYPDIGQGWTGVGTSSSTTFGVMAANGNIDLRVTVTSDDGAVSQGFVHVWVTGPGNGCSPQVFFC
jgi:subtilisin family serine protease